MEARSNCVSQARLQVRGRTSISSGFSCLWLGFLRTKWQTWDSPIPPKQNSTGRGKVKLGILWTYTGMCVRKMCRAATALICLDGHEVISWTHRFLLLSHWGKLYLGSLLGGVWIFLPEAHGSLGVLPWLGCNLPLTFTVDMEVLQGAMRHLLDSDVVFCPCL